MTLGRQILSSFLKFQVPGQFHAVNLTNSPKKNTKVLLQCKRFNFTSFRDFKVKSSVGKSISS